MKSVVLLSAGLDSTYNLAEAVRRGTVCYALTFDYGQQAAAREIHFARAQCDFYGIRHEIIYLPWLKKISGSALTDTSKNLPAGTEIEIDDLDVSHRSAKAVWVPNRNGVMLNIAASYAEVCGAECVIPGFNIEEATTFPDNTEAFLSVTTEAFSYSTSTGVKACCFSGHIDKIEIMRRAVQLDARIDLIWPCYRGGAKPCGQCESCQRFARAWRFVFGDEYEGFENPPPQTASI